MAKKTKKIEAEIVEVVAPKFTPCRQCGNTGDCERAARCVRGFK